jgi:hypothetical protein
LLAGDHTKEIFIRAPVKSLGSFMANLLDVVLIMDVVLEVVTTFDPRVKDKRLLRAEREKIEKSIAAAQEVSPEQPHAYHAAATATEEEPAYDPYYTAAAVGPEQPALLEDEPHQHDGEPKIGQ